MYVYIKYKHKWCFLIKWCHHYFRFFLLGPKLFLEGFCIDCCEAEDRWPSFYYSLLGAWSRNSHWPPLRCAMLIYQLGLPPLSMVSPESSDRKGMMRKGGSVFSEYRTTYKADQRYLWKPHQGFTIQYPFTLSTSKSQQLLQSQLSQGHYVFVPAQR